MRVLICLFLLLCFQNAHSYSCPESVTDSSKVRESRSFLKKFAGNFKLGDCQVEIVVCDDTTLETDAKTNPVAEIMLIDQYDREIYLSLFFPQAKNRLLKVKTKMNKRMLSYKKKDRYYEEELGRTEHYQLEVLTDWDDVNIIKSLHLGVYSTNNQLNQSNGNDSTWSICEEGV